ncbi:MAG: hypothetical protein L6V92_03090 [Phocaeicola vulgatus]|nr:MAG: hypothetical protein L6V92_03090 [Phocaeicola vulgatus]
MEKEERYEVLGEIANNAEGETIKGSDIASIVGLSGRALFSAIAAAYRYFYKKGDGDTAENIARTFVDEDGNYAYCK